MPRSLLLVALVVGSPSALAAEKMVAGKKVVPPGSVTYDKGLVMKSAEGDFLMRTNLRMQTRYEFADVQLPGESEHEREMAFEVYRLRLEFTGHAVSEAVQYAVVTEWGKGAVALKDGYIDWNFAGPVRLRSGQFKRPFSRQQLTSDWKGALVDRAIVDKAFGNGRDVGLMLHNNYTKSPTLEWAAGVFNGTGDAAVTSGVATVDPATGAGEISEVSTSNVPAHMHPMLVARLGMNIGEIDGYDEIDFQGKTGGGIALNLLADLDNEHDGSPDDGLMRVGLDFIAKAQGFSTTGGYFMERQQVGTQWSDQDPTQDGLYVQAAWQKAERFILAARYAAVLPHETRLTGDLSSNELTMGPSLLWNKHDLRWTSEVSLQTHNVGPGQPEKATIVRSQLALQI